MCNDKLLMVVIAVSAFGVTLIGCKSERSRLIDQYTEGNIKKMSIIYNIFTINNKYKGPEDEAELKEWVASDAAVRKLSRLHIDSNKFDQYMISERTHEKFEIRWGVDSRPMGPPRPVVFEATAVEGVRQVGLAGGADVLNVDTDAEYDELMEGYYIPKDYDKYPNRKKKPKKKN